MIDSIFVAPNVHFSVGLLVLLAALLALVVAGWSAWKRRPMNRRVHLALIFFQIVLMVQILIGIKLLDQGLGALQLYIHYLGGLAPLAFCLVMYWLSMADSIRKGRFAAGVAVLSFLFVLVTFAAGSAYVPG